MFIHHDPEGDYIEVRFGNPAPSYYEDLGEDTFKRRDRKTNQVTGYAIFNITKRQLKKQHKDIEVELPLITGS